ncbi:MULTISPECIES: TetR/AcrR family transcriptional regulator [unclassified Rathayibacter]|uniref:TetR/AcrR family transcriptional regulator n=1 Tax=unclassified Rathayibacter TaxID=2609250 RepID=UPI0006F8FB64|nr:MULTISPECIES: TetR/AcrR family transcriptional regulator [unclassified Rathayibacter]KQQ06359.1 TetR family transcriptional regulator [Rathayibacter sp. Leaf294]KQS14218.1 TetR family transcriptional regulator [Rathayibacter sp. Leaf185]
MTRWAPDAASRLHESALELFLEQGFAATTVPQIAERAGLTTRSFFRYYADKREVLFVGEEELPAVVARVVDEADPALAPMAVIHGGLRSIVLPRLELYRSELLRRWTIVRTDEALRERELRKLAIIHEGATEAFVRRGLAPLQAEVAGRLAVAVYDMTLERWLTGGAEEPLADILAQVVEMVSATATAD